MKRLLLISVAVILGLSLIGTAVARAVENPPQLTLKIPSPAWYFNYPYGVAVDSAGNVYVADTGNNRIQKFAPDGSFLAKWGSYGSGDGQFLNPYGVAVDAAGNVYVADGGNDRIQKFAADGSFLAKWGSYGSGDGQFFYPEGVAVDSAGNVYVADTANHRIQKFTPVITADYDGDGYTNEEEITWGSDPYNVVDIPEILACERLVATVQQYNLKAGVANNLDSKLQNVVDALTAANAGNREDAVNKLQAFINACEAQRNKELTDEQANTLVAKSNAIIASLQLP